jgi:perosamine synthetase
MTERKEIQSNRPYFPDEDVDDILGSVRSLLRNPRNLGGGGAYTEQFEKAFASYIGTKYATATSSGTTSLMGALQALRIGPGEEVIVPTNTFMASPNSVIMAGGKPVLADINEKTLCLDINDAVKRINNKTVGVMAVHLGGLVCPEIEELVEICKDRKLFLIEDCSHAHGATFKGRKAGSMGDIGCFSLFATKVMTTGEGGMLSTNNEQISQNAKLTRYHGQIAGGLHVQLSGNSMMNEVTAILGISQLKRLEEFLKRRNEIATKYNEGLRRIDGVNLIHVPSHIRPAFYKYSVLLDDGINTEELIRIMKTEYGIETGRLYYPPCHLQPLYRELFGYREGMFPVAEHVLRQMICLPVHVKVTDEDADYVLASLRDAIGHCYE